MTRRRTAAGCMWGDHEPGDWTGHPVQRAGNVVRTALCRACRMPTMLRDCSGAWCHKTCAEAEAARDAEHLAAVAAQLGRPA